MEYQGASTNFNTGIEKGTWQWYVEAFDSNGISTRSSTFSFITVSSECKDVPPSPPVLHPPSYSWENTLQVTFSWTISDLGVACEPVTKKRSVGSPTLWLTVFDENDSVQLDIELVSFPLPPFKISCEELTLGNRRSTRRAIWQHSLPVNTPGL